MADRKEHQPGTRASITGRFEELNIFGSPTRKVEHVQEGERFPRAPRGFSWRHIEGEVCSAAVGRSMRSFESDG